MKESHRFETALARLEEASAKSSEEGLTVEALLSLYREGLDAAKECLSILDEAEREIDGAAAEFEVIMEEGERNDRDHPEGEAEDHQ